MVSPGPSRRTTLYLLSSGPSSSCSAGWVLNPGSTLGATDLRISVVAINTNLAAIAGSATAMLVWYFTFGKPDISMACNGMLAGLVAITAPCAFVSPTSATIIGVIAGVMVCYGVLFFERV